MEITNQVREYAEKGMAEMSEKFAAEGGELYKEKYAADYAAPAEGIKADPSSVAPSGAKEEAAE